MKYYVENINTLVEILNQISEYSNPELEENLFRASESRTNSRGGRTSQAARHRHLKCL